MKIIKKILPFLNLFSFILVLLFNYLANALPLNNVTTGQVSDSFPSLFTPAGFTFAIWGVIYLLLGVFVIYQLGFAGKEQDLNYYRNQIGFYFFTSCLLNIAWLFAWHYKFFLLSLCLISALLLNLIIIYLRINGKSNYLRKKNYLVTLPFSIYLGWIMVATVANSIIYLISINWDRFGYSEVFFTNIVLIAILLIFLFITYIRHDVFVMLVCIWAATGILYKHVFFYNSQYIYIIITAAFVIGSGVTSIIFSKK